MILKKIVLNISSWIIKENLDIENKCIKYKEIMQCGWYIEGHHFYGFTNSDDSNLCHFDLGWARVLEVDSRIKVDPGKFVKK